MLGLELVQPADSRTDEHATLLGGELGEFDARILHRGLGSHQCELREAVEVPRLLDPEAGHRVPVTNLPTEVNLELGRVEKGQRPDTAAAGAQRLPERMQAFPQRRDHPHAGDDDAPRMSHVAPNLSIHGIIVTYKSAVAAGLLGVRVLLDVIDRLADGLDLLGLLVGDGDVELFFEFHHKFHGVERIGTEVVDEGGLPGDLVLGDSHLFTDDFDDTLFHGHGRTSSSSLFSRSRHHDHEPLEPLRFKQDAGVVTVPKNWIKTVLESNRDGTRLATGCRQSPTAAFGKSAARESKLLAGLNLRH